MGVQFHERCDRLKFKEKLHGFENQYYNMLNERQNENDHTQNIVAEVRKWIAKGLKFWSKTM